MSPDTTRLKTRILSADAAAISDAVHVLTNGGLVAFPTETVYGLGARADDPRAVASLYTAKGRPSFNPLIAHVRDIDAAKQLGTFGDGALKLADKFWPGPLTIVVKATTDGAVCELARAGLETIAIRMPSHDVACELLAAATFPIVAPSANRSGHVSPTTAQHVADDLDGKVDLIIDGGATAVGLESTIVDCSGAAPRLLRSGGIARAEIEKIVGRLSAMDTNEIFAPGMMASHYAPRATIRLDVKEVQANEVLLAFGPNMPANAEQALKTLNLSPQGNVTEAAANLYAHLRALDLVNAPAIAVAPIPHEGLGEAIRDRLQRAAVARPREGER